MSQAPVSIDNPITLNFAKLVPISGRGNEVDASDSKDNEHAESENIDIVCKYL